MFEYLLTLLFLVFLFVKEVPYYVKLIELIILLYITYKQPLLGIICAIIFIQQITVKGRVMYTQNPIRFDIDEQIRPKSSNCMQVSNSSGLPPQESLTGSMSKPYLSNTTGNYTPF
jgi:hypothetical protein